MPLKNDRYTYRLTWSGDDQEYAGLCAEFPSLSWLAKESDSWTKTKPTACFDVIELFGSSTYSSYTYQKPKTDISRSDYIIHFCSQIF